MPKIGRVSCLVALTAATLLAQDKPPKPTGEQKPAAAEIASGRPAVFPCPLVGTWKLNVAKSQGAGPSPPSMEATVTRADETGFAWDLTATDKDGNVLFRASYAEPNDGKDHPIDILPGARTVAYGSAEHELIATFKDASGNVVQRNRYRYSSDCSTETLKAFRMDTSGEEVLAGTEVFERQPPVVKPTKETAIKK
jgi:hypothetical protein